jgi:KDO2-lipid IV(A) lauroyltransferase
LNLRAFFHSLLLRLFVGLTFIFPPRYLFRLANPLASIFDRWFPHKRREAVHWMKKVFPGQSDSWYEDIYRKSLVHLAWATIEVLYVLRWGKKWVSECITEVVGGENLPADRNSGALFLSAHIGNWELLGAWLCQQGFPLLAVEKPQSNRYADRLIERLRRTTGIELHSKDDADFRPLVRAVRSGKSIGLIADQNAGKRGVIAPLMGIPTSTFTGPVYLSYITGLPLIPVFAFRSEPGRLRVEIWEPIQFKWRGNGRLTPEALAECAAEYNRAIENAIRKHPEQWLWLHRRWRHGEEGAVLNDQRAH